MSERVFSLPSTLTMGPTLGDGGPRAELSARGLLPDAVRAKARQALQSGEPLRMTIRALGGHISKPFAFTPEFLQSLAETAPGAPIFKRVHDGSLMSLLREPQVEGVIEGARAVDGGLEEDIAVHGPDALHEMAMGVAPTYSIQWRTGPGTALSCSACNGTMSDDHEHYPGAIIDGERVNMVFGGRGQLIETTRTYTPSADGTHVRSVQLSDDLAERVTEWLADNPSARKTIRALLEQPTMASKIKRTLEAPAPSDGEDKGAYMARCQSEGNDEESCSMRWDESRQTTPAAAAAPSLTLDERAELTRLRAERMADQEILAELLAEKEQRTIATQRKLAFGQLARTGLKMTVDRLSQLLAEAPTVVEEMLLATPSSARGRVPVAGPPPVEGDGPVTASQLRQQANILAEEKGTDARDELIALTIEAQKAGRLVG